MKSIYLAVTTLLFGVIFLLSVTAPTVDGHNVTWGQPLQFDVLLHRSVQIKKSKFLQVVTTNYTYPNGTFERNNRTITAIVLIDQVPKSAGYAQIYSGGVGFNHTTIHFKSERSKALNFIVEIYGRGFY